ncbi:hypothetical protein PHMEG_0009611 [Phytophthora megakarya]|uniref:Uncharacterized protein n=1 Tax=Phytophthora megakarya TaxID=4795 RepID=A0A225WHU6_9STRA|nr:hypothetical protein PHMEG_0009611 [Phytophthora megakarya]
MLVKSRETVLNAQISEINAVIKGHQAMYDRLENQLRLAHRGKEMLTKEVNQARSEYLVGVQVFNKSYDKLHQLLSLTHSSKMTLTLKLRERNSDRVRQVKRLEKAKSALVSALKHEDMDPEAVILMVEGEFLFSS